MKTHIHQGTVLFFFLKESLKKFVVFDRCGCSSDQEDLMKDTIELHGGN